MDLFPWIPGIVSSAGAALDRKSTRLNSSHSQISYAVFCLKKKKRELKYNTSAVIRRNELVYVCMESVQLLHSPTGGLHPLRAVAATQAVLSTLTVNLIIHA